MTIVTAIGAVLLFLLKLLLGLLAVLLVLLVLALLCPFCADVSWEGGVLRLRAGALGITFPVLQWPKPAPAPEAEAEQPRGWLGRCKARLRAALQKRKEKRAARAKAKKSAAAAKPKTPRKRAKLTVDILCTILRGAGTLTRAVFGALRVTKIKVCLAVRGADPAQTARAYGKANAWLYASLGFLDRFLYLDFEELRLEPDFGDREQPVPEHVSFRISARLLFVAAAAVRVLIEFWREKVLDVFL